MSDRMSDLNCWNCSASLAAIPMPLSRHANCLKCYAELHCCRQCRHYAPTRPTQCTDERTEPPVKKDIANFCEWFEPANVGGGGATSADAARAKLDALFGGSPAASPSPSEPESKEAKARAELERLFGKKKGD